VLPFCVPKEANKMQQQIISYVGTAQHLYWLVTGQKHPKVEEKGEQNNEELQTQNADKYVDSLPNVPGPSLY